MRTQHCNAYPASQHKTLQDALPTFGAVSSYVNCKSRAPIKASGWACRVSSSARRSGALRKVSSARPRVN